MTKRKELKAARDEMWREYNAAKAYGCYSDAELRFRIHDRWALRVADIYKINDNYIAYIATLNRIREALKKENGRHLNDIPLQKWDNLAASIVAVHGGSLSDGVCALKARARQLANNLTSNGGC